MRYARTAAVALLVLAAVAIVAPSSRRVDAEPEQRTLLPPEARAVDVAKHAIAAPLKIAKYASVASPKPIVLPAFASVEGTLDPRIRAGYELAATEATELWPVCGMRWTILAGIGSIESANGMHHDGAVVVSDSGVVFPPIVGLPLDGESGRSRIGDTDGGLLDGDAVFDRAVGPLQFIPSTWKRHGRDANGDGAVDPHSIDDAALAAASYLCVAGDLRDEETLRRALFSYNHSDAYVSAVREQITRFDVEFGLLSLPDLSTLFSAPPGGTGPPAATEVTTLAPPSPTSSTTTMATPPPTARPPTTPPTTTSTTTPSTTKAPTSTTSSPTSTTTPAATTSTTTEPPSTASSRVR